MAWTQQHAANYGGDISRFVMLGDSAGGNLVINASYRANQGTLTSSCGGRPPHVDAVSVLYPAVDPAGFHDDPDLLLGSSARNMTEQYTGGTPAQFPDRYRAITSTEYINPAAPPTLVIVGQNDHLVPPQGTYTFCDRARQAGVDIQLIRLPYSDHVMDRTSGSIGSQLFRQTSQAWLAEHTRPAT
jgi:acetyl esterase/lipase